MGHHHWSYFLHSSLRTELTEGSPFDPVRKNWSFSPLLRPTRTMNFPSGEENLSSCPHACNGTCPCFDAPLQPHLLRQNNNTKIRDKFQTRWWTTVLNFCMVLTTHQLQGHEKKAPSSASTEIENFICWCFWFSILEFVFLWDYTTWCTHSLIFRMKNYPKSNYFEW